METKYFIQNSNNEFFSGVDYDDTNTPIFDPFDVYSAVAFDSKDEAFARLKDLYMDSNLNELCVYRIVDWIVIN